MNIDFNSIHINDSSIPITETTLWNPSEEIKPLCEVVFQNTFKEEFVQMEISTDDLEKIPIPESILQKEEINQMEISTDDIEKIPESILQKEEEAINPFDTKEKMILLFDVDGTICVSSQEIEEEMKRRILQVKDKYGCDLGVVGASSFDKIEKQLGKDFLKEFVYVFAECGSVVYNAERKILLKNNIRKHKLYSNLQKCMKHSLRFISEASYEIGGNFMDIRNGLVYISLVGMDASFEMREHFKKMDQRMGFRKRLLLQLNERCDKGIRVIYGGETGITMYPKEWDKVQALKYLKEYPMIHYFGDRYEEDGNDYEIIHHPKVIGHKVDGWKDTMEFLKKIL